MTQSLPEDEGVVFDIELDEKERDVLPSYQEAVCRGTKVAEVDAAQKDDGLLASTSKDAPRCPATPPQQDNGPHHDLEDLYASVSSLRNSSDKDKDQDPQTPPNKATSSFTPSFKNTRWLPSGPHMIFSSHHLIFLSPTTLHTDSELQARLFPDRFLERDRSVGCGSSSPSSSTFFWSNWGDDYDLDVIDLDFLGDEPVMSGALDAEDSRCEVCPAVENDCGGEAVEGMVEAGVVAL